MRDVTHEPPSIKIAQQQLECVKFGSQTLATCSCGLNYVPVAQRVAEYDKANPGKSERAAAADLGISKTALHEAREAGGHQRPPEVTGRDNKTYPATKPRRPTYTPEPGDVEPKALPNYLIEEWAAGRKRKG